MNCPECGAWSVVLDTRGPRRRRECGNGHRFSTIEIATSMHEYLQLQSRLREARRILKQKGYLR